MVTMTVGSTTWSAGIYWLNKSGTVVASDEEIYSAPKAFLRFIVPADGDYDIQMYGDKWHADSETNSAYYMDLAVPGTIYIEDAVHLAQQVQDIVTTLPTVVKYGEAAPTLTVSGAKTSLSYKSSNTNVAKVDASGKLSIVGCGDTTITVTTAETSDWFAATVTLKLSVGKGSLTVKAAPSGSNIVYGQTLSNSSFTGGTVTNSAGTGVGGTWSWKTPTATPSAGKQTFIARYTPTDTVHYEY